MASTQGQDVVLCQLCPNPVEHHCNLCHFDLCSPCILKHLADKTNKHEIVEFINKKEGPVLPECDTHKRNRCEMYCRDCCIPTCVVCVTTEHKKHDFTDIREIIENRKQQIIGNITELENVIVSKYQNIPSMPSAEFDKILNAMQNHEDKICNVVREISSKMRNEVAKEKQQYEQTNKDMQSLAVATETKFKKIIQNNKEIITACDAMAVIGYQSRIGNFRDEVQESHGSCFPNFEPGLVKNDQIVAMFGELLWVNM